jgi:hypothetical protein
VVSFFPWLLYQWGKTSWYKLNVRLDEPQNQSLVTPGEKIYIALRMEREQTM